MVSSSIPARATCKLILDVANQLPADERLWRAATARFPVQDVRVEWETNIPKSRGLGGSTALLAATLACVLRARGEEPELATAEGRSKFAELVRDVELNDAEIACGFQDAYMVVHGGLQEMDFDGKEPESPGPIATLTSLQMTLPFLLISTDVERLSGSVHGPMIERWRSGEREVVRGIAEIVSIGAQAAEALRAKDWTELSDLMTRNHAIVASLGGSGEAIDALINDSKACGALAAKLAGAGMGGTVIALTMDPHGLQTKLRQRGYTLFMRPSIEPGLRFEESR